MRLFIAVNCDDQTTSRILLLRNRISAQAEKGVFSRPENWRLTLAFLGETPPDRVPAICSVLSAALGTPRPAEPFTVRFSRTGCFRACSISGILALQTPKFYLAGSKRTGKLWIFAVY
jgi:2'-5' RNA ligase